MINPASRFENVRMGGGDRLTLETAAVVDIPVGIWDLTPYGALLGILIILFWLLATGRLIPRSSHERELAQANHRGDEWKESALQGRELITEQSKQLSKFAEASKTPAEFFGTVMRSGGDASASPQEKSTHA